MAIVYRYMDVAGGKATINNGTLLLSNPALFNDPFDANPGTSKKRIKSAFDLFVNYMTFTAFSKEVISAYQQGTLAKKDRWVAIVLLAKQKQTKALNRYVRVPRINKYVKIWQKKNPTFSIELDQAEKRFEETMVNLLNEIRDKIAICCFTHSYDDVLMWGHYGNSHKGVCVAFEIPDEQLTKVSYSKKRGVIDYKEFISAVCAGDFNGLNMREDKLIRRNFNRVYTTKPSQWSYEKEYRMIRYIDEPGMNKMEGSRGRYTIEAPKIKAIYLGAKMSQEDERFFYENVDNSIIHRMTISDDEFKVTDSIIDHEK